MGYFDESETFKQSSPGGIKKEPIVYRHQISSAQLQMGLILFHSIQHPKDVTSYFLVKSECFLNECTINVTSFSSTSYYSNLS